MTKEYLKAEIDLVPEEYLGVLYQIIKVFEYSPPTVAKDPASPQKDWRAFVAATYGCLANDPIERGPQGQYEIREALE